MLVNFGFKKIMGLQGAELKEYFEDLELDKVIPKLLQFVFEQAQCENVTWLLRDEWAALHQNEPESHQIEPETTMNKHIYLQPLKPITEKEIRSCLKTFSAQSNLPQCSFVNNKANLILPLRDYRTHQPIAFLLITGVTNKKPDRIMSQLAHKLSYMERHISFCIQHWEAQKLSFLDDLTNLYNQKYLSLVLQNEIFRCQREQRKFSVLFMDIDYFKVVNDTRGHWVGSRLLVDIGCVLKESVRKSDFAFRYGGDEFVLILPNTDSSQAKIAAERIRTLIEQKLFMVDGEELHLTLSIGLATFPDHAKTYKDIIKMADEAMYCGKNKSRNIVFVAS